jgi:hypothetical protein
MKLAKNFKFTGKVTKFGEWVISPRSLMSLLSIWKYAWQMAKESQGVLTSPRKIAGWDRSHVKWHAWGNQCIWSGKEKVTMHSSSVQMHTQHIFTVTYVTVNGEWGESQRKGDRFTRHFSWRLTVSQVKSIKKCGPTVTLIHYTDPK